MSACRQVLPDGANAIKQINIIKTEPETEDDVSNMETVDQIKTQPMDEDDDDGNANDYRADQFEFEIMDEIIKEEPRVESAPETESEGDSLTEFGIMDQIIKEEPRVESAPETEIEDEDDNDGNTGGYPADQYEFETMDEIIKEEPRVESAPETESEEDSLIFESAVKKESNEKLKSKVEKKEVNKPLEAHLKSHEKKEKPRNENSSKYCGKTDLTKHNLEIHQEAHERKKVKGILQRYVCHYCPSKFTTLSGLQIHQDRHNIPPDQQVHKRLFCYVCDHDFETKDAIQEHLYSHADILPYTCEECETPLTIKSVRVLNRHLEMHKGTTNGGIKCPYCPLRFHSLKSCKLHEVTHVTEGGSILEALERRAKILSKKQNVKIIVLDGKLRYVCDLCDKSYALLSSLRDHTNAHTESIKPKKLNICKICNKTFTFAGSLRAHVLTHSTELPYKCEYCEKAFKNAVYLIEHRRIHTGEKPLICGCGMAFRKRSGIKCHMKICPGGNAAVQSSFCRFCGNKSFPSYADLIAHVTEEHKESIPKTKCQFCPTKVRNPLQLVRHEHLHQLPNVIQCDKCNRIFKNQALLKEHEIVHMESFSCDHCGKKFDARKGLLRHKRRKTCRARAGSIPKTG